MVQQETVTEGAKETRREEHGGLGATGGFGEPRKAPRRAEPHPGSSGVLERPPQGADRDLGSSGAPGGPCRNPSLRVPPPCSPASPRAGGSSLQILPEFIFRRQDWENPGRRSGFGENPGAFRFSGYVIGPLSDNRKTPARPFRPAGNSFETPEGAPGIALENTKNRGLTSAWIPTWLTTTYPDAHGWFRSFFTDGMRRSCGYGDRMGEDLRREALLDCGRFSCRFEPPASNGTNLRGKPRVPCR